MKLQLSDVMYSLHKEKLNFKDVYLTEKKTPSADDEDAPMVEDYYRLIANLLGHISESSLDQVTTFYRTDSTFARTLRDLKPLILEDED